MPAEMPAREEGLFKHFHFKLMYFLYFGSLGFLYPYLPLFYETLNFRKASIGVLCLIPNFAMIFFAPIMNFIADKTAGQYELLICSILISSIVTCSSLLVTTFDAQVLITIVSAVFRAPVGSALDSLTLSKAPSKEPDFYGTVRLYGAIGFGIVSFLGGAILAIDTHSGSRDPFFYIFVWSAILALLTGFVVLYIVHTQNDLLAEQLSIQKSAEEDDGGMELVGRGAKRGVNGSIQEYTTLRSSDREGMEGMEGDKDGFTDDESSIASHITPFASSSSSSSSSTTTTSTKTTTTSQPPQSSSSMLSSIYKVLRAEPLVGVFCTIVLLSGIGMGVVDSFLFLRLKQLGAGGLVMGVARFITCASEVPMFQVAGVCYVCIMCVSCV